MSHTRFSYDLVPLPNPAEHIRLVDILPPRAGPSNAENATSTALHAQVYCVPLKSKPPFAALSYTWGDDGAKCQLKLCTRNSRSAPGQDEPELKHLPIAESLEEALLHIRNPTETVTLWIDQICINQNDTAEKSVQVGVMGEIYRMASSVLIWLGPGTGDAIERMNRLGNFVCENGIDRVPNPDTVGQVRDMIRKLGNSEDGDSRKSPDQLSAFVERSYESDQYATSIFIEKVALIMFGLERKNIPDVSLAIKDLFTRPWFSRVWVLQEYGLAYSAVFLGGRSRIAAEMLNLAHTCLLHFTTACRYRYDQSPAEPDEEAMFILTRSDMLHLHNALSFDPLRALSRLRFGCRLLCTSEDDTSTPRSPFTLSDVAQDVYKSTRPQVFSKDPRDRIYALLGLASDINELGISPDYGLPVDAVYTQAARAMMESGQGSISLLEMVNFPKTVIMPDGHLDNGVLERMPSCVPDFWHHGKSISLAWPEKSGVARRLYTPFKPLPSDPLGTLFDSPRLLPTTDTKVFGVQGIIVDEIVCTGEVWQGTGDVTLDSNTYDVTLVNSYFQEVDTLCRLSSPEEKVQKDMECGNDSWVMRIMLGDAVCGAGGRPRRFGIEDVPPMHQLLEVGSILKSLRQATNEGNERAREHFLEKLQAIEWSRVMPESSLFTLRLNVMTGKRPFRTNSTGYVGMGPHLAQPVMWLFYCLVRVCPMCFVLLLIVESDTISFWEKHIAMRSWTERPPTCL